MDYYGGVMTWPIDPDWQCETCGKGFSPVLGGLTWGFVNGQCRCDTCHTPYMMRDGKEIRTSPRSMIKDTSKEAIKKAWDKYQLPFDEMDESMIEEFMEANV